MDIFHTFQFACRFSSFPMVQSTLPWIVRLAIHQCFCLELFVCLFSIWTPFNPLLIRDKISPLPTEIRACELERERQSDVDNTRWITQNMSKADWWGGAKGKAGFNSNKQINKKSKCLPWIGLNWFGSMIDVDINGLFIPNALTPQWPDHIQHPSQMNELRT